MGRPSRPVESQYHAHGADLRGRREQRTMTSFWLAGGQEDVAAVSAVGTVAEVDGFAGLSAPNSRSIGSGSASVRTLRLKHRSVLM